MAILTFPSDDLMYINSPASIASQVQVEDDVLYNYIRYYNLEASYPSEQELANIREEVLGAINGSVRSINALRSQDDPKLTYIKGLPVHIVARAIMYMYIIRRFSLAGFDADPEYDVVGIYQESGSNKGNYSVSIDAIKIIASALNPAFVDKDLIEVYRKLLLLAPRTELCSEPNLVPLNNGIFDTRKKVLMPFDPDVIFLCKSAVNYNDSAVSPTITMPDGNVWQFDPWLAGLSDDPEIVKLLWQIISAALRPNVHWGRAALLYSSRGCSGKGTLCDLIRGLIGEARCASIPLDELGKDFALEQLIGKQTIICDENNVDYYIDKLANFKALVTGDVVSINRKYKTPITYRFKGLIIECINAYPKVKDKSDSFYRRQLIVPFDKCFTGSERPYIKDDYLKRTDVLEYIVYKAVNMDFDAFAIPEACKLMLDDVKESNVPHLEFFNEVKDHFTWDFLPFTFLYDTYKSWFKSTVNSRGDGMLGRNKFISAIVDIANAGDQWYCEDKHKLITVGNRMSKPEPIIGRYNVEDWYTPRWPHGSILDLSCPPSSKLNDTMRGLIRRGTTPADTGRTYPDPSNPFFTLTKDGQGDPS